ncbi:MAG: glutaredoxin domain-containing protein [Acidimicrobiia bacterium]
MLERLIIVALLLAGSFGVVLLWQRRGLSQRLVVPAGLTIVSTETCRDCDSARAAFDRLGISYQTMSVSDAEAVGISTRSVPTAVVGGPSGSALIVRRGRAVITDSDRIAAVARSA